jgi:hypothetical protein
MAGSTNYTLTWQLEHVGLASIVYTVTSPQVGLNYRAGREPEITGRSPSLEKTGGLARPDQGDLMWRFYVARAERC